MFGRATQAAMLILAVPVLSAASDKDSVDLPLSQIPSLGQMKVFGAPITAFSVGSVGVDSHSGGSYLPAKGDDPYYFAIPSQKPASKSPGFTLTIPLGSNGSR